MYGSWLLSLGFGGQIQSGSMNDIYSKQGEPAQSRKPSIKNGIKSINNSYFPNTIAPMHTQQPRPRIPEFQFRVLIIGRANAGKTSILQRVCEATESPIIYQGRKKVRGPTFLSANLISLPTRLNLTRPWMLVTVVLLFACL